MNTSDKAAVEAKLQEDIAAERYKKKLVPQQLTKA